MTEPLPQQVTAAIIRRSGKILLARRQAGGHLEGLWEFPGGKREEGESPEECLARELREEFELEATVGGFLAASTFTYDDREIELLAYEVDLESGEFTLNSHDEVRWVDPDALLSYELAPADIPIAEAIRQGSSEG